MALVNVFNTEYYDVESAGGAKRAEIGTIYSGPATIGAIHVRVIFRPADEILGLLSENRVTCNFSRVDCLLYLHVTNIIIRLVTEAARLEMLPKLHT